MTERTRLRLHIAIIIACLCAGGYMDEQDHLEASIGQQE